jgi:hypothetical protein
VEALFQLLAELVFQFVVEGVLDLLFGKTLGDARPLVRFLCFLVLGALFGGLSLLVLPAHLVHDRELRYVAVLTVPILLGSVMARIGRAKAKRGTAPNDLEHFFASWGFAFTFGAIRILFAR